MQIFWGMGHTVYSYLTPMSTLKPLGSAEYIYIYYIYIYIETNIELVHNILVRSWLWLWGCRNLLTCYI